LIFDEVQTAFGRTGKLFAYERYDAKPDIMTLAKALGAGVAIGAMAATNKVMKSFVSGTHAATFGGNPLACTAALAAFKVYTKPGFLGKVDQTGDYFFSRLKELGKSFSIIKEVRGVGLLLAIELKQPAGTIVNDCMRAGYLINCIKQNILRFIPPLIVTKKEIDGLIEVLAQSLKKIQAK